MIDKIGRLESQYSIIRFMSKAQLLPTTIFGTLSSLVEEDYLHITKIEYGVNFYKVTSKGKDYLDKNFNSKTICEYADTIDPTGFFSNILLQIENKDK